MTKTLSTSDWTKIDSSFSKMKEKFPHAPDTEDTPICRFTSIKGVKEQLQELSVGECVLYMDYLTSDGTPKISKCEIIEE